MAENQIHYDSFSDSYNDDSGSYGDRQYIPGRFRSVLSDGKEQRPAPARDGCHRYLCIPSVD